MSNEMLAAIVGGISGGLVSLAIEGFKAFQTRRNVRVTASISLKHEPNKPEYLYFNITITNVGGPPIHITEFGIFGPAKLTTAQRKNHYGSGVSGYRTLYWSGWLPRVLPLQTWGYNLAGFNKAHCLQPGQPHTDGVSIDAEQTRHLNGQGLAYAKDSLGSFYFCRFTVPNV
jgi:hypothetical protein